MTREGVLGLEYLKWSDRATPEHNVTIPFTRMLAGPMDYDYTLGAFNDMLPGEFKSRNMNPMDAHACFCRKVLDRIVKRSF
jgi:alpha-glucosidase